MDETPKHYQGAIQPIEFMRSCLTKEELRKVMQDRMWQRLETTCVTLLGC